MVAQYPLGMGREPPRAQRSNALPVQMDEEGRIKFDSLLRQGQAQDKIIHSRFDQTLVKHALADDDPDLARPSEEDAKQVCG